ncbi:leucine--tRNA ligase [Candidatus Saccharibacteria bacterium]|jgi:leucyl-tRNA synthetase|nr:leucine--tRNA ligase [Candidatus Saccharibacteria bacterium]
MKRYNPSEIEPKWQQVWSNDGRYAAKNDTSTQKFYISGMFPYPSGAGMHIGHAFEHSIVDAMARFQRAQGRNVLNPVGWDSFGLPAENYAIKTGTAPAVVTKQNIANFTNQLRRMGVSLDWSREINTADPRYYKWTQWIFTKLYEKGLAYQKEANQWWCPVDKTVLANEQVEGGKCWRCESTVEKRAMKQWFFKITEYADALLDEITDLDWPEKIKSAQINWIGRSEGAEISFEVEGGKGACIKVFSTRPDTLFGATFMVLAPEHNLIKKLVTNETRARVDEYIAAALKKSEIERMSETKEKSGVFTGSYATNPATGERMPIWVADYVLGGYGTGAVMAVPAHDERDLEFAKTFDLPVVQVIERPDSSSDALPYTGEGELINSGAYSGMQSSEAREDIVTWLTQQKIGTSKTTYKMRDWLVSRQRYWGAPIPIVHTGSHGAVAVAESCLPVDLPHVEDYAPTGKGSVLQNVSEWVNVWVNVKTGETKPSSEPKPDGDDWVDGQRETDTMDGYACSSWYLLRYTDPHNNSQAWSPDRANFWAPLDMYVGGDHAVAHLLYVRFWTHVFYDLGLTNFKEPVKKLVYHGYINAEDGTKMSKSKGNVVDPLEVIDQGYGADTLRTFELFLGPINENSNWNERGIAGVYRFLNRAWTITQEFMLAEGDLPDRGDSELQALRHSVVKKVTDDLRRLNFNTAIAALMEYVNSLYKLKVDGFSSQWRDSIEVLVQLLSPFAPHMSAELWQQLGNGDMLDTTEWPRWDDSQLTADTITIVVQVNGKLRGKVTVPKDAAREEVESAALANENVAQFVGDKKPTKIIYVPGRLVNVVVR